MQEEASGAAQPVEDAFQLLVRLDVLGTEHVGDDRAEQRRAPVLALVLEVEEPLVEVEERELAERARGGLVVQDEFAEGEDVPLLRAGNGCERGTDASACASQQGGGGAPVPHRSYPDVDKERREVAVGFLVFQFLRHVVLIVDRAVEVFSVEVVEQLTPQIDLSARRDGEKGMRTIAHALALNTLSVTSEVRAALLRVGDPPRRVARRFGGSPTRKKLATSSG